MYGYDRDQPTRHELYLEEMQSIEENFFSDGTPVPDEPLSQDELEQMTSN